MKKLATLFLVLALVAPMTGCYHNTIITQPDYNAAAVAPDYENDFNMFLIAGLIPLDEPILLNQVCAGTGAGIVETERTFLNELLNNIIGIVISFNTARVYCATGRGAVEQQPEAAPAAVVEAEVAPALATEAPTPAN